MIRSMTGFARRERQGSWGTLACEIRSVNHRYLELSLRLPDDLRSLEGDARQAVSAALRRGKVDVGIYLRGQPVQTGTLEINRALVDQLARTARDVAGLADSSLASVSPLELLRWPGVIREPERDLQPAQAAAMELLQETVAELNESRAREGARLREMLLGRCQSVQQTVGQLRERLPEIAARIRERVGERVAQLGGTVDPSRLEQELVLLAYKMDFAEELDRLGSHVTEMLQILDAKEPAGRRLDFLMQEFNREANTLSSKSQDADTTRAAMDMKVLIEQMREQIQNIE
ncbi:MAG: hypothetical protein RL261_1948 [Pseudomonadota bacterium]